MAEYQTISSRAGARTAAIDEGLRAHMNKVYGIMSVGMVITAAAAWAVSGLAVVDGQLTQFGAAIYTSPLKWLIMFAPLIMVFAFGAAINRLSAGAAQVFFYAFAVMMGLSISSIFLIYTGMSIVQTFVATAAAFAGLSLYGYTTKKDLSGMGTFLMMGLIGIIIASIVNIFIGSSAVAFAISVLGVLIFAGLTAYDTQRIKSDYIQHAHAMDSEWLAKSAIMGALNLYLDFINLFMFLLSFMGQRE
ncbi:Bax inhibitor-1/YccA family protein [Palleronia caenipelagi]|uniref:Bax inhibitor-1/YccA family protein n=1 Tax=Palleronia caenipelagi TaxID=2489174 RepID=A0A547QB47_9RHOB|nr:Bax inhibitor-1/YccA family protein [Palleronia caenipelagi]TRD23595.1 Bax inhibitor-1/YccA family protein [Palleronia caenipelagi]